MNTSIKKSDDEIRFFSWFLNYMSCVFKIWQSKSKSSWVKCFTFSAKTEDFTAKAATILSTQFYFIFFSHTTNT